MPKPLTLHGQGLAEFLFKRIVPQAPTENQVFSELTSYIKRRQLTNAVELLERELGVSDGEILIFYVAVVQTTFCGGAL